MLRLKFCAALLIAAILAPGLAFCQQDLSDDPAAFALACPDYEGTTGALLNNAPVTSQSILLVQWPGLAAVPASGTSDITLGTVTGISTTIELDVNEGVVLFPTNSFNAVSIAYRSGGPVTFVIRDPTGADVDTVTRPADLTGAGRLLWIADAGQAVASVRVSSSAAASTTVLGIEATTCTPATGPANTIADIDAIAADLSALAASASGANENRLNNAVNALATVTDPSNWDANGDIITDGFDVFPAARDAVSALGRVRGVDRAAARQAADDLLDLLVGSVDQLIDEQFANGASAGTLTAASSFVDFAEFFQGIGRDRAAVNYLYLGWYFAQIA